MTPLPCVGIDLGTTCSAIAQVIDGTPTLFQVDGQVLLPSVVFWNADGSALVGQPALNMLMTAPRRGVTSSKRHMGTGHTWDIDDAAITPVDVATKIIGCLLDAVATETGARPDRAVITVPAWFTQAQRADTRMAGERAGLTVERLINEPTAAALAHAHGQPMRRKVLVYDLGGGTFDASVVHQDGDVVEVLASHGDSRLGGDDIDDALRNRVLHRLNLSDPALRHDLDRSPIAQYKLRVAVEATKVALSQDTEATLRVPFVLSSGAEQRHISLSLNRSELDEAAAPWLRRTLASVDQVLADAKLRPDQLDELLLVGGATLQPRVWHLLHAHLGLQGSHAIDPRRAVVLGAAIQAAIVDGSRTDGILMDVAPYSLSVAVVQVDELSTGPGVLGCRVITPRNTPLPSRHAEVFHTLSPTQRRLEMAVFQGSSPDPRRNTMLGEIIFDKLEPAPAGRHERPIRVVFRHDLNGLVDIELTDELSQKTVSGQVAADGEEQGALWAAFCARIERGDTPFAADPSELAEALEGAFEDMPFLDTTATDDEAAECFALVVSRVDWLESNHAEECAELLELARTGGEELDQGRRDEGVTIYDKLSDRLFELGIYL
jgi:molecular chaperone DnaK